MPSVLVLRVPVVSIATTLPRFDGESEASIRGIEVESFSLII
jgi:hypothetical protein